MSPRHVRLTLVSSLLCVLFFAAHALAGPPLLCHPYDIGQTASLPWDGSTSWFHGRAGYELRNLVRDTGAVLTASTPVVARMETIRRAAIYASLDRQVAIGLVRWFNERARSGDALALLDAALVTETLNQLGQLGRLGDFRDRAPIAAAAAAGTDGRAYLRRALEARPDDAAFQFAAAIIMAGKDRQAYEGHARKARAGGAQDPLLSRNLNHVN